MSSSEVAGSSREEQCGRKTGKKIWKKKRKKRLGCGESRENSPDVE
jgi:hypothetical protein